MIVRRLSPRIGSELLCLLACVSAVGVGSRGSECGRGQTSDRRSGSVCVLERGMRRTIEIVRVCLYRFPCRSLWIESCGDGACGCGLGRVSDREIAKAYESACLRRSSVRNGSRCRAGICPDRSGSIVWYVQRNSFDDCICWSGRRTSKSWFCHGPPARVARGWTVV